MPAYGPYHSVRPRRLKDWWRRPACTTSNTIAKVSPVSLTCKEELDIKELFLSVVREGSKERACLGEHKLALTLALHENCLPTTTRQQTHKTQVGRLPLLYKSSVTRRRPGNTCNTACAMKSYACVSVYEVADGNVRSAQLKLKPRL